MPPLWAGHLLRPMSAITPVVGTVPAGRGASVGCLEMTLSACGAGDSGRAGMFGTVVAGPCPDLHSAAAATLYGVISPAPPI